MGGVMILVVLLAFASYGVGFYHGGEIKREEYERLKADGEKAKAEAVEKEDETIEFWTAKKNQPRFVSVPRAVQKANESARKLIGEQHDVIEFAKFCREELERELRSAEVGLSINEVSGKNSWMGNAHIRNTLRTALLEEGFDLLFIENEDLGYDKVMINVIGRK